MQQRLCGKRIAPLTDDTDSTIDRAAPASSKLTGQHLGGRYEFAAEVSHGRQARHRLELVVGVVAKHVELRTESTLTGRQCGEVHLGAAVDVGTIERNAM